MKVLNLDLLRTLTAIEEHGGFAIAAMHLDLTQSAVTQQLADAHALAQALGVEGTPAFFVGDVMIPGADMEALKSAIATAKGKSA